MSISLGDTIKHQVIQPSDLFIKNHLNKIVGVTFDNCVFQGPGIVALSGDLELLGCTIPSRYALLRVPADVPYVGLPFFIDCTFRNCRFDNIAILASHAVIDRLERDVLGHK